MALISCSECGKEVSDKAASCPNCGNPIAQQPSLTPTQSEEYLCCPKCGSRELHSDKKGFSGGKALAGAVLTGGIGLLAGTIGSKDVQITCLKCGKQFKAGEARICKPVEANIDDELVKIIQEQGIVSAAMHYREKTGNDSTSSAGYVSDLAKKHNIDLKTIPKSGCAPVLLCALIITALSGFCLFNYVL